MPHYLGKLGFVVQEGKQTHAQKDAAEWQCKRIGHRAAKDVKPKSDLLGGLLRNQRLAHVLQLLNQSRRFKQHALAIQLLVELAGTGKQVLFILALAESGISRSQRWNIGRSASGDDSYQWQ